MGDNLFNTNPWLAGLTLGGTGLAGLFPNNNNITQNGNTTTTSGGTSSSLISQILNSLSQSSGSGSSTSTPNIGANQQALIDQLTKAYSSLAAKPVDANAIRSNVYNDINANSSGVSENIKNIMASKGLANSPVAATSEVGVQNQRFRDMNQFSTSLPLLLNQLKLGNLGAAAQFQTTIPHGTTTTTSQNQQTSNNQTSTGSNDIYQNSNQQTINQQQQQQKQGGGIGGFLGNLFKVLPVLAGL